MKRSVCRVAVAIILVAVLSGAAAAQTFLFKNIPGEKVQLGLRFMRPSLADIDDLSTFSGIYDFSVSLPLNERWSIDASLPYTTYSFGGDDDGESYIGNTYAGMQYLMKSGTTSHIISFGAYIPTADDDFGNLLFGVLTNYEDMFKYYPDVWTIYGNYALFSIKTGGARLGLEIGPDLMIPTGDGNDDTEFLMHYGLTAGYQGERFAAFTEFIGLVLFTGENDDFSENFAHSINFGLSYVSPHFLPGVFYKIYLKEEYSDMVDGVIGVNLEFTL